MDRSNVAAAAEAPPAPNSGNLTPTGSSASTNTATTTVPERHDEAPSVEDPMLKPFGRIRKPVHYRFRRSALAAYFVIVLLFVTVIAFLVFITEQPQGEAPTLSVLEFCSLDELEECKERLQSRLSQGTIGILRTPVHFFFTLGSIVFTVLLAMVVQAYRARRIKRRLQIMPRKNIDLWSTMDGTTRSTSECFSREMFLTVNEEMSRIAKLSHSRKLIPYYNRQKGDVNWGDSSSRYTGTHFPTSIALSYQKLDEFASRCNPDLKLGPNESIRDFVERLKRHWEGKIDPRVCDSYVQMYEEAKFGNVDLTEQHYDRFINIIVYLFDVLEVKQENPQPSPRW